MFKIKTTFRKQNQKNDTYTDIMQCELQMATQLIEGNGTAENPYHYNVKLKNPTLDVWKGVIHFKVSVESELARFFLPAFIYGRNQGEKECTPEAKLNPRVREGEVNIPYSSFWMTRADRLSHPVAMLYVEGRIIGISSSPYRVVNGENMSFWTPDKGGELAGFNGFTCALGKDSSVGFTVGYEDAPYKYIDGKDIQERKFEEQNCVAIKAGETIEFPIYIYDITSENETGINDIIENVYWRYHESPREGASFLEGIDDISHAIYADAYMESAKSYATMLFMENGKVNKRPDTSISWTGGVEIATPLLMAAHRKKDEAMRKQALECIQFVVDCSMNEKSGLPYEAFIEGKWSIDGWWQGLLSQRGHTSYVVGQALYYILKAYDCEIKFSGIIHEDWIQYVETIVKNIEATKNGEGEYPYIWSEEDGRGIEYDSFAGCWCLATMAYLAAIKQDKSLLESCIKDEKHYYEKFVKHMECYATPIDTFKAVDSEGILAYIRTVKFLHEQTNDAVYLEHLKQALGYEFSYKFCYNVPIQVPPLSRIQWSCSGGSVTSTANPHIHPMSNGVVDEIIYFIKHSRDAYHVERMKDTIGWGLQTYSRFDGEYDFGKKGWMSERFCYSEGLLCEKYEDGSPSSTWFYYLPWGASNIIEGMCGKAYDIYLKCEMEAI